ncbi:MAG: DUF2087 domain-containing protein [Bacilli bacterium]
MPNEQTNIWDATIAELVDGFLYKDGRYTCLFCTETTEEGRVYPHEDVWYDAKHTMRQHVLTHGGSLAALLAMNSTFTGVSDVQRELITRIALGKSDKEIAEELGITHSTVRNHRYKLREKEKQARIFLAIMEGTTSMTEKKISALAETVILDAHPTANQIDDRFNITASERDDILRKHVNADGSLKNYPAKEKRKIVILQYICDQFEREKQYSEKELNEVIKAIYDDFVTVRRALIEYGFIDRTKDGSAYWRKIARG